MGEGTLILLAVFGLCGPIIGWVWRRSTRVSRTLIDFVGARDKHGVQIVSGTHLPATHETDALRALRDGLPELGFQVQTIGLNSMISTVAPPTVSLGFMLGDCFPHGFGQAQTTRCETAPGRFEDLPSSVLRLCDGGDLKVAIVLMKTDTLFFSELWFEAAVGPGEGAAERARALIADLEHWMTSHSVYRRRAVAPVANPTGAAQLAFANVPEAAGLVFDDALKEDLELNFLAFVRHRDALAKLGVSARRGLLLCGPPGTGKTSTCRYLRSQLPDHTFFLCSAQAITNARQLFELATRLAPSVVVIEDVDLAIRTPDPSLPNPTLKDLLNEMDGLEDRSDVMVVLTSNSTLPLEQALADRPGRIDHTIRYRPPGLAHRRNLLAGALKDVKLLVTLDDLVQQTDGLTPAQLAEMVKKAVIRAIRRAAPGSEPQLSPLDVRAALDEVAADSHAARGTKDPKVRPLPVK